MDSERAETAVIDRPGRAADADADGPLGRYRPGGSFLFATPRRTMLARGVRAAVPPSHGPDQLSDLADRVSETLAATDGPDVVVGAIPFARSSHAALVMPETLETHAPLAATVPAAARSDRRSRCVVRAEPDERHYQRAVGRMLPLFDSGELAKVVLSRTLRVTADAPFDIPRLLANLARRDPHAYVFAADLPPTGPGPRTLVGASPELLVSRHGTQVIARPLAGSAPRGSTPDDDKRRAAALLASDKDRREHAVVVDAVAAALRPWCRELDVPTGPSLSHTAAMWHLGTTVRGELADPTTPVLTLAAALHPTPAVCGWPLLPATTAISETEGYDRDFYTGMVGWSDGSGDGEWVVTLRCAEATERRLRLYAGAGIVAGSVPESELAETAAKFGTLLSAIDLGGGRDA